jgi:hypothetical protein
MLLVKNDPNFNEQWPRPLVPYQRIYGVEEPARVEPLLNDGKLSSHLPEGTPFGLVGTSSLYKRETFPNGRVPEGGVTATGNPYAAFSVNSWITRNWQDQGADAGLYSNEDIHAVRILAMEPPSAAVAGRFYSRANERLRILGEIPVRKFAADGSQPVDPDGNPDTSFLAKVPADVAWTFQTLDKDGMVLNMAQTWHQVRPGEVRNNCGGCHAHSQKPTDFNLTAAAKVDYPVFDLTKSTPLLTAKADDQSQHKWDAADSTGVRVEPRVKDVEYFRDVQPILQRSCVACHSHTLAEPKGGLVLDPETDLHGMQSFRERFDHVHHSIAMSGPSSVQGRIPFMLDRKYVWDFQSRRSLLVWKVYGRRTDGLPKEIAKGFEDDHKMVTAVDYDGKSMPPEDAAAEGEVQPLSDEDKRSIVSWIDLGCPIDWDYNPAKPDVAGRGWMLDDQRPTLALTYPRPGANRSLTRILVGMHDYGTGLDPAGFTVTADFPLAGAAAGENLAPKFEPTSDGVWELALPEPLAGLPEGTMVVSVKDRQGNVSRIERTFSVGASATR